MCLPPEPYSASSKLHFSPFFKGGLSKAKEIREIIKLLQKYTIATYRLFHKDLQSTL